MDSIEEEIRRCFSDDEDRHTILRIVDEVRIVGRIYRWFTNIVSFFFGIALTLLVEWLLT